MKRTPLRRKTPLRSKRPIRRGMKPLPRFARLRRRLGIRTRNEERAWRLYEKQFGLYAEKIRDLPCCISGRYPPSDPSHVKSRGAGGTKRDIVPMSWEIHQEFHLIGIRSFEKKYSVNLAELARGYWLDYGSGPEWDADFPELVRDV